jgi:hypothetical protein
MDPERWHELAVTETKLAGAQMRATYTLKNIDAQTTKQLRTTPSAALL